MQAIRRRYKKATATRKGRIILLSLIVIILVAVAGGFAYWTVYKKRIIRDKLETAIREKSKGLYQVTYDSLKLDEVAGNLSITNFSLRYDSLAYVRLEGQQQAPPSLLRIMIPEITVLGVKTPRALIDNEIVGRKLLIRDPQIEILYTNTGKDSARTTPTREVYEQILGNLDLIRVDSVEISGGRIVTKNFRTGKVNIELAGTDIRLYDVAIDSASNLDTTRILFAKKVDLICGSVRWSSANKLYNYGADSIQLHSTTNALSVKRFFIEPTLGEAAFMKQIPTQDDRFDFTVNRINITGIRFQELFNEKVIADSIIIGSSSFKIYRDLNLTRDKKNRVGTYPHQAIAKIPIPVQVGKVVISSSFIEYKERGIITKQSGKVQFYNAYATITNLTNSSEAISRNNIMSLDLQTRLLNKAPLKTNWRFYLGNKNGKFTVSGNLGRIARAEELNVLTEPMGPARIEKGDIHSLDFNFTGDDYGMNGTVKMIYDDLRVAVLQKDDETKKLEKRKLVSFVANLIVKNSNPSGKKDEPRIIEVKNERDPNRSIFHLAWKSLFKGVKESVGIKL